MLAYLKSHWRGQQTISESFLVNGVLALLVLGAPLASQPKEVWEEIIYHSPLMLTLMNAYLSVFVAWFGWFAVGTARSAVRTLRGGYRITSKILAIIALVFLAAMLVRFARDWQIIARWIRGLAC
jgi:hypothetical protein